MAEVKKGEVKFENKEPEKCTDWHWMKWDEFVNLKNHFIPFKYFFGQGFDKLSKIREAKRLSQE